MRIACVRHAVVVGKQARAGMRRFQNVQLGRPLIVVRPEKKDRTGAIHFRITAQACFYASVFELKARCPILRNGDCAASIPDTIATLIQTDTKDSAANR